MKSIKPKNTLRKRFIAAESDTLVIETIQTIEGDTLRSRGPRPAGDTLQSRGPRPAGDTLRSRVPRSEGDTLRSKVPRSEGDTLRSRVSPGTNTKLRILKLKGTWRANDYNELCFEVACRKGPPEIYTFKGSWKLNNNQQIEYTSQDGRDTLTFKGYWQISSANRLAYILKGSSTSCFEFKVQLESPVIYPKKGEIRYRIGVGIRQSRLASPGQILILYGEWKFGRNLGLTFQMDYGQGMVKTMEFGAEVIFEPNKLIFALKNELGKPLGITLTMTHKFLEHFDAEAFIRLKSRQKEQAIEAGISIPF